MSAAEHSGASRAEANAVHLAELVRHSLQIADRAVVADIEDGAQRVRTMVSGTWWDVRPMLDEREHSATAIDMATQALAYAQLRGLVRRHDTLRHLVQFTRTT